MCAVEQKDIRALSEKLGLGLSELEVRMFSQSLESIEKSMEDIADMTEDRPPVRETTRIPGYRPSPDEDPLNCIITKCLVRGADRGPLRDKRIGLKDHVSVAGVPMTLGSQFMEGYVPGIDATVVTRLLAAGADIVAKLNMDPFSHGSHGIGTGLGDYGRVLNPHDHEHLSGGSSSGTGAAVAAGIVDMGIGGDQGGSIRIPAAWCGCIGLKPTLGLVPHTGVAGIEPWVDFVGPMTRTVEDAALLLECIAGPDGYDPRQINVPPIPPYTEEMHKGIAGLRIGILQEGFGDRDAEPDVEASVREAAFSLQKQGAIIQDISIPEHRTSLNLMAPLAFVGSSFMVRTLGGIFLQGYYDTHFAAAFSSFLKNRSHLLPHRVKQWLLLSEHLESQAIVHYGKAHNIRRTMQRAFDAALQKVDCLVMPTTPMKAPHYSPPNDYEEALHRTLTRECARSVAINTAPFNITGHPAMSLPCAISQGLPVGIMLVSRWYAEEVIFRIAYAFEHSVDWDKMLLTPPIDVKNERARINALPVDPS